VSTESSRGFMKKSVRIAEPAWPAAGRRRERRVAFADSTATEAMASRRRIRTQPPEEVLAEPEPTAPPAAASSDVAGENTGTPPVLDDPGMLGSVILL
jgi:hypothetical protein